jgi:hypothetical protein
VCATEGSGRTPVRTQATICCEPIGLSMNGSEGGGVEPGGVRRLTDHGGGGALGQRGQSVTAMKETLNNNTLNLGV